MAIVEIAFKDGLRYSYEDDMWAIITANFHLAEVTDFEPGLYDITPPQFEDSNRHYELEVFPDETGVIRILPGRRASMLEIKSRDGQVHISRQSEPKSLFTHELKEGSRPMTVNGLEYQPETQDELRELLNQEGGVLLMFAFIMYLTDKEIDDLYNVSEADDTFDDSSGNFFLPQNPKPLLN